MIFLDVWSERGEEADGADAAGGEAGHAPVHADGGCVAVSGQNTSMVESS
jgi:hypothetical protein